MEDQWPACISDRNEYVAFSPNISSLARVGAFEQISRILGFGTGKAPSPAEFTEARVIYTQEQGIESRVSRREDEHYPPAAKACRDMTEAEIAANTDRCVGPAKIRPILNAAFQEGMAGQDPALNAARIEGALLWFLYISIFKEATTAADHPARHRFHVGQIHRGRTAQRGRGPVPLRPGAQPGHPRSHLGRPAGRALLARPRQPHRARPPTWRCAIAPAPSLTGPCCEAWR